MLLSERSESNQRIAGDGQDKISAQSASSYIVLSPDPITWDWSLVLCAALPAHLADSLRYRAGRYALT